jgi:hypothetical protein
MTAQQAETVQMLDDAYTLVESSEDEYGVIASIEVDGVTQVCEIDSNGICHWL